MKIAASIIAIGLFLAVSATAYGAPSTHEVLVSKRIDGIRYRAEFTVPQKFLTFHPFDSHILINEILTNKRALRIMPTHKTGYGYVEIEFVYLDRFGSSDEQQITNYLVSQVQTGNDIAETLNQDNVFPIQIQEYTEIKRIADKQQLRAYAVSMHTKKPYNLGNNISWQAVQTNYIFIQLSSFMYLIYSEHGHDSLPQQVAEQCAAIYQNLNIVKH